MGDRVNGEVRVAERAENLARQFEEVSAAFAAEMERLSPAQWTAFSPEEGRTVAALARHVAWAYEAEMGIFVAIAEGRPYDPFSDASLARINAEDGQAYADCDQAETVTLLRSSAARTAAAVRALTDDQLARTGLAFEENEAGSVGDWIDYVLIGHPGLHLESIRAAAGSEAQSD